MDRLIKNKNMVVSQIDRQTYGWMGRERGRNIGRVGRRGEE